ncbi:putative xyloglucan:xyloglucosyl transferase [Dioscorea sansibarensis]
MLLTLFVLLLISLVVIVLADFNTEMNITWGGGRATISNNGLNLTLSMDQTSGSGCESKAAYLYGRFDVQMKLIKGDSAGTVTTFYLSSDQAAQDEVDMEFLGNLEGKPYTLSTNVFTHGKGRREQKFHLWFDPTADFHHYAILWTPSQIISFVDGIPIRGFGRGTKQLRYVDNAMTLHTTLWDGSSWATDGGKDKVDWSKAPFNAYYRNLNIQACLPTANASYTCGNDAASWIAQNLTAAEVALMDRVRGTFMTYNYCTDPRYKGNSTIQNECSREL